MRLRCAIVQVPLDRVPPKLMAHARDAARTYGKSDPIDALAVARAALREPNLPTAHLDGPAREVRLLVDHRDALVAERIRVINRLRWHLHELDPTWQPPARSLNRTKHINATATRLRDMPGLVARLSRELLQRCRELNEQIARVERELANLVHKLSPALLTIRGCAVQQRRTNGDSTKESIRALNAAYPTSSTERCSPTPTAPTLPRRPRLDIGASGRGPRFAGSPAISA